MIVNNMTSVRVNFLISFERRYGRKPVVTRQELLAFQRDWTDGEVGGLGMVLRYPSWLTNPKPNPFKVGRAAFRLPWDDLDAWNTMMAGKSDTQPVEAADDGSTDTTVQMIVEPSEKNLEAVS